MQQPFSCLSLSSVKTILSTMIVIPGLTSLFVILSLSRLQKCVNADSSSGGHCAYWSLELGSCSEAFPRQQRSQANVADELSGLCAVKTMF